MILNRDFCELPEMRWLILRLFRPARPRRQSSQWLCGLTRISSPPEAREQRATVVDGRLSRARAGTAGDAAGADSQRLPLRAVAYLATRSCVRFVPICVNTPDRSLALVIIQNLL